MVRNRPADVSVLGGSLSGGADQHTSQHWNHLGGFLNVPVLQLPPYPVPAPCPLSRLIRISGGGSWALICF